MIAMHHLSKTMTDLTTNFKVAIGVVAGTISAGVSTLLELIPDDIGKLASFVGIILSLVLIAVHITVFRKHIIELEMLKEEQRKRRSDEKL